MSNRVKGGGRSKCVRYRGCTGICISKYECNIERTSCVHRCAITAKYRNSQADYVILGSSCLNLSSQSDHARSFLEQNPGRWKVFLLDTHDLS